MKQELDALMKDNPFLPLSDAIYQCLFRRIVYLTLPPGSKLGESRIAEELGVSRTPVKGALTRLTQERLVQKRDGKLLVVSPMTKQGSRLLYEIGDSRLQPILADAARHHQVVYRALHLGFADVAHSEMERDIGAMNDVFSA